MNKATRVTITVGAVIFILILLFPPWRGQWVSSKSVSESFDDGHHFLVSGPEYESSLGSVKRSALDWQRLLLYCAVVTVATGTVLFWVRTPGALLETGLGSETPQKPHLVLESAAGDVQAKEERREKFWTLENALTVFSVTAIPVFIQLRVFHVDFSTGWAWLYFLGTCLGRNAIPAAVIGIITLLKPATTARMRVTVWALILIVLGVGGIVGASS